MKQYIHYTPLFICVIIFKELDAGLNVYILFSMNHKDHINLLRNGIHNPQGTWADLGAGRGAFTLALAELLQANSTIYAIDKKADDLQHLQHQMVNSFPDIQLQLLLADFTKGLNLPSLDGIVMANSLHFIKNKAPFLSQMRQWLKPNGRFLLVEYNVDKGNRWVPYPLSFKQWQQQAKIYGFQNTELIASRPSRFLGEIFAAASW